MFEQTNNGLLIFDVYTKLCLITMLNIELKDIHIGQEIKKRLDELQMTKTEFGRRIGVPQQHVNRIFDRDTIETKRLVKICHALDCNFFALFCQFPTNVNAYLAAVALGDGDANNNIGEAAVLSQVEVYKERVAGLEATQASMKGQIEQLRSQLTDKETIIELLKKTSK